MGGDRVRVHGILDAVLMQRTQAHVAGLTLSRTARISRRAIAAITAPTMIQPSASRASEPAPEVRISGSPLSTVEIIVITTGRSRISAP